MDSPSRNDEDRAITDYHDCIVVFARVSLSQKDKPEIVEGYKVELVLPQSPRNPTETCGRVNRDGRETRAIT